ncbi:MFS transporter [Companilactobacillus sp. RD055328]|uniref:MDR family MFS transporter n=1 Tax=Companilactobacillus sp. RD055328 TaxID=2916634 RepID=UPI001FC7D81A|nr:MDR family MFS transporter [Companilactobacillus sp. RD055328]GKQ42472.1 MFS transporter [Companilactobacillus sp. RD055328]
MNQKRETNVKVVTVAVFVATFMTAVEGTIVSTAMPTIIGSLHGVSLMNWVFSIYLLMTALSTPIYGKMADIIGRKPVFIFGLILFTIGSLLCGLSNSMEMLILSRVIQGLGAGSIQPVAFTIIADIYPIEKRARVIGLNGSAWGIAAIIAPLIGGFIVEHLSWHWVFMINIPIGIITIFMIYYGLIENVERKKTVVDYKGTILLVALLLSMMLGMQSLSNKSVVVPITLFAISIIALIAFIYVEKRAEDSIIPLKLFTNKTFVIQNMIALLVSGYLIGFEAYIPTWMQGVLGLRASLGGFAVTPSSIMWIIASLWAGYLLKKMAPNRIIYISLIFLFISALGLVLAPITSPFWYFLLVATVSGMGFGLTITTTTVATQSAVPEDEIGVATSFNTLSRMIGQTLMVSVFGIVLNQKMISGVAANDKYTMDMMNKLIDPQTATSLPQELLPGLRKILFEGLHNIYIVGLILIILTLVLNLMEIRNKKLISDK